VKDNEFARTLRAARTREMPDDRDGRISFQSLLIRD